MNIIRKVQFDFEDEALEVLKANEEWSEYQRNKEALQKELNSLNINLKEIKVVNTGQVLNKNSSTNQNLNNRINA